MWKSSSQKAHIKKGACRRFLSSSGLIVLSLILLTACAARSDHKNTQAKSLTPITTTSSVVSLNAIADLKPTILGHVNLLWEAHTSRLIVHLKMSDLLPDTHYFADIEQGSCKQMGTVLYRMSDLESDALGNLDNSVDFRNVESSMPPKGWSFHFRNELQRRPLVPEIACAEIINPVLSSTGVQQTNLVLLAPQPITGSVKLHLQADELTIDLLASSLSPQGSYFAHVHLGNCGSKGKVVYNMNALTVDKNGIGKSTTVVHGVGTIPDSGWYVNLHIKADSLPVNNDVVACGDVHLQLQHKATDNASDSDPQM